MARLSPVALAGTALCLTGPLAPAVPASDNQPAKRPVMLVSLPTARRILANRQPLPRVALAVQESTAPASTPAKRSSRPAPAASRTARPIPPAFRPEVQLAALEGGVAAQEAPVAFTVSEPQGKERDAAVALAAAVQAEEPVGDLSLQAGRSRVLEFKNIKRVVIGDPSVADVAPVTTTDLVITAKKDGETTLLVWDDRGRHAYRVVVAAPAPPKADLEAVARQLRDAIGDPNIRVRALGETIILEGRAANQAAATRAEVMAQALHKNVKNLIELPPPPVPVQAPPPPEPQVAEPVARVLTEALTGTGASARAVSRTTVIVEGKVNPADVERVRRIMDAAGKTASIIESFSVVAPAPSQVLIRARVVDINRTRMKDLGVDWGNVVQARSGGVLRQTITGQPFTFGITGQLFKGNLDANPLNGFGAQINALVQDGAARILSEPNILVLEGGKGNILVGGEFPIPVVQNSAGGLGSVSVQFKEFGVRLGVEPLTVTGPEIVMRVMPEVSLLDFANAVRVNGFNLPALRTRREESTIRINAGQTLAIGGLLEDNYSTTVRRIPLLSKIPILGQLFQSKSFLRNETELVILITPEIVPVGATPTPVNAIEREAPGFQIGRPDVSPTVRPEPKK